MIKDKSNESATHQSVQAMQQMYKQLLEAIGEDGNRNGLIKTPERAAKALHYLTNGYKLDPTGILMSAMFDEEYSEMVIVKGIEVYSLCEHHLLPFFGKAHIAYIPNGHIFLQDLVYLLIPDS